MAHAYNPSTLEAGVGGSPEAQSQWVSGQPELRMGPCLKTEQNREQGLEICLAAESTCFCQRPGFDSQHSHGGSEPPITTGAQTPSSDLYRHQVHTWCTHLHEG